MSVLILGAPSDEHARHVLQRLKERGTEAHLLDSEAFPQTVRIDFEPSFARGRLRLLPDKVIDLHSVTSIYWRTYGSVRTPDLPNAQQSMVAQNDARGLFESLLKWLPARWVNGWDAWQLHQTKPAALARVAELGAEIPDTVVTNDPEAVRSFVAEHECTIFKPVQGGAHTRRLTPEYLTDDALARLSVAPVTIQEEIPGTNIRTFVAGDRVVSCEVETEALDFRDDPSPTIRVHRLPPTQSEISRNIARTLQLLWTGIDYRLRPDGTYVFLEANPSPMFLGFEARTGLPLSQMLLDLLRNEQ